MASRRLLAALLAAAAAAAVVAQSSNSSTPAPTPSPNVTRIVTSVPVTTSPSVLRGNTVQVTSFAPTTITSTFPPANASATTTGNASATSTPTPTESSGPVLETKIDGAFGVLGALLVLTGLPSAFLGHKNRWSSFFLTGFYSLSLACLALILKYGVLVAVHPPNKTLRGLFVLACGVAGVAGGGISIFFWQQSKYFIGAWGGFALGLWVQCFRNAGLIRPIGFRWILYIACGVIGFVLCTIPRLHYHVLIAGTAITGASAFMLGVDCFTTAGMKEFYVYNLGFSSLFPKFSEHGFPLSQVMEVELGLIAAVALMGAAVQLRVLGILKRKLKEINDEERKRELAAEAKAVARFEHVTRDMDEWEKEHGKSATTRPESGISGMPLMKDMDEPSTPGGESTLISARPRTRSGLSELALLNEDGRPQSRFNQNPGLLPAMNLGLGLDSELPSNLVDDGPTSHPDLLKKEELLAEIQTIRKSIDALRSEGSSASGDSRRPSMSMHTRTLSGDAAAQIPPRPARARVHSMDVLSAVNNDSHSNTARASDIGRPNSTPLRDDDWEAYLRERKLFQPPSGPSAPIATTPLAPTPRPASSAALLPVPDAVAEALASRRRRESAFELGGPSRYMDETHAPAPDAAPRRSSSVGPVKILPPRTAGTRAEQQTDDAPRTRTFEELVERHQEKLRALQAPLSAKEKEQAELEAAKRRWDRNRAAEKEAVARRRAEKEAALARRNKEGTRRPEPAPTRHSRSLSADRLAVVGPEANSSSKRSSTAKVQEWQRYQQQQGSEKNKAATEQGVLPFPNASTKASRNNTASAERRGSRSGVHARDPPS